MGRIKYKGDVRVVAYPDEFWLHLNGKSLKEQGELLFNAASALGKQIKRHCDNLESVMAVYAPKDECEYCKEPWDSALNTEADEMECCDKGIQEYDAFKIFTKLQTPNYRRQHNGPE